MVTQRTINGAENKTLFIQRVYSQPKRLDKLCERSTFFLIGEKGNG